MAVLADLGGTVQSINPATAAAWIDFWPCHPSSYPAAHNPLFISKKEEKVKKPEGYIVDFSFFLFFFLGWARKSSRKPSKCRAAGVK